MSIEHQPLIAGREEFPDTESGIRNVDRHFSRPAAVIFWFCMFTWSLTIAFTFAAGVITGLALLNFR